jgi:hypothetical protein
MTFVKTNASVPTSDAGDNSPRTATDRTSKQNPIQFIKKEREIRKSFVENSIPNLKIFLGDLKKDELKKPQTAGFLSERQIFSPKRIYQPPAFLNYEIDQSIHNEVSDEFQPPTIISREAIVEKQHERNERRLNLFKVRLSKVAE